MRIILVILGLIVLCAALFAAGVLLCAFILERKRPLVLFYEERAAQDDFAPFSTIPPLLVHYLVQIEDDGFYTHPGYSITAIREAWSINRSSGKVITGGTTITQQLIKNLYFRFTHNYLRKAVEVVLAASAEKKLGKQKILELYLNVIYFGNGIYGIRDAARFYFDKELKDLTMNQMFMLASMPYAPTKGNPIQYPQAFETIRNRRLDRLVRQKAMPPEDADSIRAHHADCLDPELRGQDDLTRNYPQYVPLVNESFGPAPHRVDHAV